MADKSLIMTFLNEEGTRANVTLPDVKDNISQQEVSVVMDTIIAGNIFSSTGGNLIAKHSAQITERNVTDLVVR
ncbi:DUF2922 domain-containing protein [Clostridium sp. YIM B02515]|uniref:DUF2922 domain-containing protein n=1 Tax=Clostridium rhizosphaerae TaxID=2803861 RepID=A0ABS1T9J0_9CLOT|nr:DUF2922 domain-containing protein [Clostridium rhizosphaerae]MBL4935014.1 DUF2922 domain-containing protein [Clostridium rhizosphaerae]